METDDYELCQLNSLLLLVVSVLSCQLMYQILFCYFPQLELSHGVGFIFGRERNQYDISDSTEFLARLVFAWEVPNPNLQTSNIKHQI